jgi:hypothetical protein
MKIVSENTCSVCKDPISIDCVSPFAEIAYLLADDDLIAFFCGHIYHKDCLLDPEAIEAVKLSRVRGLKQGGVANKITEAALLKPYLSKGCEVCGTLSAGNVKDKGKGISGAGV